MANSDYRILYKSVEGVLAIITPANNCDLNVEQIAQKDVPTGHPYKIVLASELDLDDNDEFRNAWTCDDEYLSDGVGAEHGNDADSGYLVPRKYEDGTLKPDDVVEAELQDVLYGVGPHDPA